MSDFLFVAARAVALDSNLVETRYRKPFQLRFRCSVLFACTHISFCRKDDSGRTLVQRANAKKTSSSFSNQTMYIPVIGIAIILAWLVGRAQ